MTKSLLEAVPQGPVKETGVTPSRVHDAPPKVVLASTSRYRRALLQRLGLPFEHYAPDVDETPIAGEKPDRLAARLAREKADAVASQEPNALVLASDQTLAVGATVYGKPGSAASAREQLRRLSGHAVTFQTAVHAVFQQRRWEHLDQTVVRFRQLSSAEIARYVEAETPLDCAGSFKAEGLGIALFESIESVDPTGLIGFPLIAIARILREAGYQVP